MYRTTPMFGTTVHFNQEFKFIPLPSLGGFLVFDVREKPTFEEGSSLGILNIPVATITSSKEVIASIENKLDEKMTIVYVVESVRL